jgi:hypothetical protein
MSDRRKKTKLNAVKHGVFTPAFLPGEDPREFAALHAALIEEWKAMGPTEQDAVFTIANSMWRKARIQKFRQGKIAACKLDAAHPAYDEVDTLRGFAGVLEFAPECLDELLRCPFLSEKRKEHLTRKFPEESFETISARAQAIKNEIVSEILPSLSRCPKPIEAAFIEAAKIVAQDDFKNELALEERIDALINGAIKRLAQTKTMKQMLHTD